MPSVIKMKLNIPSKRVQYKQNLDILQAPQNLIFNINNNNNRSKNYMQIKFQGNKTCS